jgi:hypothetical protein
MTLPRSRDIGVVLWFIPVRLGECQGNTAKYAYATVHLFHIPPTLPNSITVYYSIQNDVCSSYCIRKNSIFLKASVTKFSYTAHLCVDVFEDCITLYLITRFSVREYGANVVRGVSQKMQ